MPFSKQQHREKIKRAQNRTSASMSSWLQLLCLFFLIDVLFLWKILPGQTLNLPYVCLPVIPDLTGARLSSMLISRCFSTSIFLLLPTFFWKNFLSCPYVAYTAYWYAHPGIFKIWWSFFFWNLRYSILPKNAPPNSAPLYLGVLAISRPI